MTRLAGGIIIFLSTSFLLSAVLYLVLILQINNKIKSLYNKSEKSVRTTFTKIQLKILSDFFKNNIKYSDFDKSQKNIIGSGNLRVDGKIVIINNDNDIEDLGNNIDDFNILITLYKIKNKGNSSLKFPIKSDWKEYKKKPNSVYKSNLIIYSVLIGVFFMALIFSINFLRNAIKDNKIRQRRLSNSRNR